METGFRLASSSRLCWIWGVAYTFHLRLECGQATVEPGFDGGERGPGYACDLFERELLVKTKDENLTVVRFQLQQHLRDLSGVLTGLKLFERRWAVHCDLKRPLILSVFVHLVEACHGALAGEVDDEIAGDGKQPGVEPGLSVVLRSAQQHPHPGLLEEILGDLASAGEEEQIAQQAVLIQL